jgi:nucleotide-binding universal stress UspA family protein
MAMSVRKLLVPLNGADADEVAIATAAEVAKLWRAHILAVHFHIPRMTIAADPDFLPIGIADYIVEDHAAHGKAQLEIARRRFNRTTEQRGLHLGPAVYGSGRATAEFVISTGHTDEVVTWQARLADLTVVPHLHLDRDAAFTAALHAALFDSGRPVLIAPHRQPATIGRRVCVAWNGTAESASGVQAVLPWLKQAEAVRVLSATGYQRRGPDAAELAAYLALHEVRAEVVVFPSVQGSVGLGLLEAAGAFEADLLAMGAYSHPRWRQMILGGVTRSVLEGAVLPVLMSR